MLGCHPFTLEASNLFKNTCFCIGLGYINCSQGTFGGGGVGWVHPGWSKCWTVGAASAAGGERETTQHHQVSVAKHPWCTERFGGSKRLPTTFHFPPAITFINSSATPKSALLPSITSQPSAVPRVMGG